MILLAVCLTLILGSLGMYYLLTRPESAAPQPLPSQAAAPGPASATPEPQTFDPLPVVKDRVGKGVSNGAKAELLCAWEGQGQAPAWVPESPSRVKLSLKHGQQTVELSWKIENGQAVPDNKLAQELENWVPGKKAEMPAFLASQEPPVEETVTPVARQDAPAPRETRSTPPATTNRNASTEWRDDGDPTRITNADLPAAAFAPKKPKADKPSKNDKPSTSPEMGSAGNLRLMGVMEGDGGTKAIINQGGQYMEVKVGENVGSYRVESISGKEVVLDKNGTRVKVSNSSGGPPPRPEKPQPPPRPEMPVPPAAPSMTVDQDLEVPPIEEPTFDPGPFEDGK